MVRAASLIALYACACSGAAHELPGRTGPLRRGPDLATGALGYHAAFLPDGRTVSVELRVEFELVVRGPDGGESTRRVLGPADYDINAMAVDRDGIWLASDDGTVRALELDGDERRRWHLGAHATAVALSPDGDHVATGDDRGVVCLRRRTDGALLQCVAAHEGRVATLDFAGRRLASGAWDGSVAIWAIPSLALERRRVRPGVVTEVAFSPDGRQLAIARAGTPPLRTPAIERRERAGQLTGTDPRARVEIHSARGSRACPVASAPVLALAWTADGNRLLYGGWDRAVSLCAPATGSRVARVVGFPHLVHDVAVAPDGRRALVATWITDLDDPGLGLVTIGPLD